MYKKVIAINRSFYLVDINRYREFHMNMGHLGADRILKLIRERFYWPKMEEKVQYFIRNLCTCVRKKQPHTQSQNYLNKVMYAYNCTRKSST